MNNKEMKNPILNELDEDVLDHVTGGMDDDGWYWGFGSPPDYLNACPKCGGCVYDLLGEYQCGPCGWVGRSVDEFAPGYTYN